MAERGQLDARGRREAGFAHAPLAREKQNPHKFIVDARWVSEWDWGANDGGHTAPMEHSASANKKALAI